MKNILSITIIGLLIAVLPATAQPTLVEKQLEIGMTVKITPCKKGSSSFEAMDMYRKTRIPTTAIQIDSATGEGIFENFFAPGDFDARRLPCDYGNKKYKVAALKIFEDKDTGEERRVLILYTKEALTMIWVEFDKAVALKEIEF
jgi:hypothetical protein